MTIILLTHMTQAQTWCPPGAEWKFNVVGFGVDGCGVDTYAGDTLLGGLAAQRIHRQTSTHYYFSDTTINEIGEFFTSFDDGVVFLYLPQGVEWDTLYWLTAPLGARWFPPGVEPDTTACPPPGGMVEVEDTGTVVLNGLPVSYRDVFYLDMTGAQASASFRIYERFGASSVGLPPGGCITSEWPYILNTYSDDAGAFYDSGNPWSCPEWLDILEGDAHDILQISPNPGTDHFTVSLHPSGLSTLSVFDAMGKPVLRMTNVSGAPTLDASAWSQGLFFITILDPNGTARTVRWVKQ